MSELESRLSETEVAGSVGSRNNVVVKIGLVGDAQVSAFVKISDMAFLFVCMFM